MYLYIWCNFCLKQKLSINLRIIIIIHNVFNMYALYIYNIRFFLFFYRASTKAAPLNINKVSSSLLNFGRKLIAPMGGGSSGISPINSEVISAPPPQAPLPHPLAEPPSHTAPSNTQMKSQRFPQSQNQHRLLKSESMPVHLSKGEHAHGHIFSTLYAYGLLILPVYLLKLLILQCACIMM